MFINFCRIKDDDQEINPEDCVFLSNSTNNPLCGRFSGLSLGHSNVSAPNSKNISYLFKPSKPLIQPPRLKLDDSDASETARTSPTVSSGYDSVTSYFKTSPDSVSEFDSISQVGRRYDDVQSELRRRAVRKSNDLSPINPRWPEFGPSKAVTPYFPRRRYSQSPDAYYGASRTLSSHHSSASHLSQFQTSYCFSTVQIVLCSVAFFVLGFSLQLLLKKFMFQN